MKNDVTDITTKNHVEENVKNGGVYKKPMRIMHFRGYILSSEIAN